MTNKSYESIKEEKEINLIAQYILQIVKKNNIQFILLNGEIGSGKTTLVKHISNLFNEKNTITSPTFNKMFVYDDFVHIDAYNMINQNLNSFKDYFEDKLVIIEWPNNLKLNNEIDNKLLIDIIAIENNKRLYKLNWKE